MMDGTKKTGVVFCAIAEARAQRQAGLTLIELLAVLSIAMLLVIVGMPGFGANKDKRLLKGMSEVIQQDLRVARTEAIKRNKRVYVAFQGGGDDWCYGINLGATCDCRVPNSCTVDSVEKVRTSQDLGEGKIRLLSTTFSSDDTSYNPVHGTTDGGSVKLRSETGVNVKVVLSSLGRVRICSPDRSNRYGFSSDRCSW